MKLLETLTKLSVKPLKKPKAHKPKPKLMNLYPKPKLPLRINTALNTRILALPCAIVLQELKHDEALPTPIATPSPEVQKEFKCDFDGCSAVFVRLYNLKSHKLCHSSARDHQCEFCSFSFGRKHDLLRHVRNIHRIQPPKCFKCHKIFVGENSLKRHFEEDEGFDVDDEMVLAVLSKLKSQNVANLEKKRVGDGK